MLDSKASFQNLIQYVLDRDATEARDALHETLVEMIFSIKDKPITANTVMHEIKTHVGIDFDALLVKEIITRLVQAGSVRKVINTDFYSLNSARKKELLAVIKERRKVFEYLEKEFR